MDATELKADSLFSHGDYRGCFTTLLESYTGCSLLTVPRPGRTAPLLLLACPPMAAKHCKDHGARRHLAVRGSDDGGGTWPYALVLQLGPSAYSDMALDPDGQTARDATPSATIDSHRHISATLPP